MTKRTEDTPPKSRMMSVFTFVSTQSLVNKTQFKLPDPQTTALSGTLATNCHVRNARAFSKVARISVYLAQTQEL